jgi:uncharacterized Zn finger protein
MFTELITPATLEKLAGKAAFLRGRDYFTDGAVGPLRITETKIFARVEGTEAYRVELRAGDELDYDCTCPRAADGYFCKHCVAIGLAWLAGHGDGRKKAAASGKKKKDDPWRDIREYLAAQPQDALIALLLDVAQRDDRLYQSLLFKAECGGGDVAAAFRRAIDGATRIYGFVDWREAGSFADNIEEVADSLAGLLKPGTAAVLVELTEYAIARTEDALEQIDDSSGSVGEIVYRLGELHLKACAMARPEPKALAERLFRLEMGLSFGLCSFSASTYRHVLGKPGLQRYRELAEAEWSKIKPRKQDGRDFDSHRFRITQIMEQLAEASGDIEELVAIKARDLSSGYSYLTIAEILSKAGQDDKALDWAERGLKAFPDRPDNRLRDFLVAAYLKRKRNDEALQLTWVQFEERPGLEYYKKLHGVAKHLGIWPAQRSRALALVSDAGAREAARTNHWKPKPSAPDHSLRVEIALWEKDLDAAWAAVQEGVCDRNLLITLAGKLEPARPNDAIVLYRRVVPPVVEQTNNAAYEEAIKLIRKVGKLMSAQKQSGEFADYLAELRVRFKPKRNFIKLLDGVGRGLLSG